MFWRKLGDVMSAPYDGPCMHEALFDETFLAGTGVSTLDFAKAMIDEGYHPMTMYFPLVVKGAMLVEPTETESKESLDRFIGALRQLALAAKAGEVDRFAAPHRGWRRARGWTKRVPRANRSCVGNRKKRRSWAHKQPAE